MKPRLVVIKPLAIIAGFDIYIKTVRAITASKGIIFCFRHVAEGVIGDQPERL